MLHNDIHCEVTLLWPPNSPDMNPFMALFALWILHGLNSGTIYEDLIVPDPVHLAVLHAALYGHMEYKLDSWIWSICKLGAPLYW